MEDKKNPHESNSVLSVKRLDFPVDVTEWILKEASNVLECSPFLGHISGLSSCGNKLSEVAISFLGKSSIQKR